jgi:hypothetical protein
MKLSKLIITFKKINKLSRFGINLFYFSKSELNAKTYWCFSVIIYCYYQTELCKVQKDLTTFPFVRFLKHHFLITTMRKLQHEIQLFRLFLILSTSIPTSDPTSLNSSTYAPSAFPTYVPTSIPISDPTSLNPPTFAPSAFPTYVPTSIPSSDPTSLNSLTSVPSAFPTNIHWHQTAL